MPREHGMEMRKNIKVLTECLYIKPWYIPGEEGKPEASLSRDCKVVGGEFWWPYEVFGFSFWDKEVHLNYEPTWEIVQRGETQA